MPSRRFHHKSSTGCKECKAQRVKCDESKPSCNRCLRQGRTCSYITDPPDPNPTRSTAASANSHGTTSAAATPPTSGDSFASPASTTPSHLSANPAPATSLVYSCQDLELLHHWVLEASPAFASACTLLYIWQDAAVKQAFKYPFLMHAIFSFSALDLVTRLSHDLAPTRDAWLKRSAHDYGQALILARPELDNINPHNCHAVFAFSSIVAITRMAMPTVTGDYGGGVIEHMIQSFHLLRGILAVLKVAFGWIKAGPLGAAMVDIDDFEPRPIDPDIKQGLEALEFRVPRTIEDRDRRPAYYEAIQRMRLYFAHPGSGTQSAVHSAAAWPVLLAVEYMEDLAARQPLALCLLAFYALMLDQQKTRRYMQDHGKRLLVAIMDELKDEEWLQYLQVPRSRVKPDIIASMVNFKQQSRSALAPVDSTETMPDQHT